MPGRDDTVESLGKVFLKLGCLGFGGPVAHIAMMEDEVVSRRGWLSQADFLNALAVTNLIPGPNSTEMAIHIGYLRAGRMGGLVSGVAFITPAFVMVLALSWLYVRFGTVPQVEQLLLGIKPAVVAVVLAAAWRLGQGAVQDLPQVLLAAASLAVTGLFAGGELIALLGAGLVGVWLYGRTDTPTRLLAMGWPLLPVLAVVTLPQIGALGWVFLKAGALLFGGGYVLIALVEPEVVDVYGWVTRAQFLDGIAIGQATPGPITTTATFIGFMAAGFPGALVATVAVFVPAFVLVLFGSGPLTSRLQTAPLLKAFLKGVNAAVVGSIAAAAVGLLTAAVVDVWTAAILVVAVVAVVRFKVGTPVLLAGAALVGLAIGLT
ncbi:MAG: chromate efflux transporter [Gemmatimonadaceae bacterium]|nr:chromate efflux transporter [Gloeobacterales cyanobacterium ES-bin-141]